MVRNFPKEFNTSNIDIEYLHIINVFPSINKKCLHHEKIIQFNHLLEKYCNEKNHTNIKFCNIYDNITTPKGHLKKIFKLSHNPYNIHLNNEYILLVLLHKCKHLYFLTFTPYSYETLIKRIIKCYNEYIERISIKDKKEYPTFNI
jgi:hypothetical protein